MTEPIELNDTGIEFEPDGTFTVARNGLGNCFGCGAANQSGLQLRFRLISHNGTAPSIVGVATTVTVAAHFGGVDGVVHGGIQATILDEVSGVAAQLALPAGATAAPCVTAELALRFRRPVSLHSPVTAQARVTAREGRSMFIDAAIVNDAGEALTTASSRWVQLSEPPETPRP